MACLLDPSPFSPIPPLKRIRRFIPCQIDFFFPPIPFPAPANMYGPSLFLGEKCVFLNILRRTTTLTRPLLPTVPFFSLRETTLINKTLTLSSLLQGLNDKNEHLCTLLSIPDPEKAVTRLFVHTRSPRFCCKICVDSIICIIIVLQTCIKILQATAKQEKRMFKNARV